LIFAGLLLVADPSETLAQDGLLRERLGRVGDQQQTSEYQRP
jgi:hypothetical protein